MDVTRQERGLLLLGPFELRITHLENDARCAAIDAFAAKLGGDPAAMFYGADPADLPPRHP
jgi:hypothetical protein